LGKRFSIANKEEGVHGLFVDRSLICGGLAGRSGTFASAWNAIAWNQKNSSAATSLGAERHKLARQQPLLKGCVVLRKQSK
jgi:hypothetical protein